LTLCVNSKIWKRQRYLKSNAERVIHEESIDETASPKCPILRFKAHVQSLACKVFAAGVDRIATIKFALIRDVMEILFVDIGNKCLLYFGCTALLLISGWLNNRFLNPSLLKQQKHDEVVQVSVKFLMKFEINNRLCSPSFNSLIRRSCCTGSNQPNWGSIEHIWSENNL